MGIKKSPSIIGTDGDSGNPVDTADKVELVEQGASAETTEHTGVELDETSTSN